MRELHYKSFSNGYSLIELLIAITLLTIVAAVSYGYIYSSKTDIGGAERLLSQTSRKVGERRSEAIRLNGEDRSLALEAVDKSNLLTVDFTDLATTASLVTEGEDINGDCKDDASGKSLTCLDTSGGKSVWKYAYRDNDVLELPTGWSVVGSKAKLGTIPLIGDGINGQGVLVTKLGFTSLGSAKADECGCGVFLAEPSGSVILDDPLGKQSPFWAVYFMPEESSRSGLKVAVAIAVHPSGYIEEFRFDGTNWRGFSDRLV